MRRLIVAAVLGLALTVVAPASPVGAHEVRCAAYVGNPCYKYAAQHAAVHRLLSSLGLGGVLA